METVSRPCLDVSFSHRQPLTLKLIRINEREKGREMAGEEAMVATWFSMLSLAVLIIFWLQLMRNRVSGTKKTKLPSGPSKLPIIGNLHQQGVLAHRSLRDLSLQHGPLMLLQLGRVPVLVVSSADMAQEFMKTHDLDFASRPKLSAAKKVFYNCKDVAFSPYGEYWRQMKKICMVELLNTKRVESFGFVRDEEVSNMVKNIFNSSKDVAVNMREEFVSLTNYIITRIALGDKYTRGYDNTSLVELFKETTEAGSAFSLGDFFPALRFVDVLTGVDGKQRKVFGRWDSLIGGVIEEHRNASRDEHQYKDFVDVLIHVQKHSLLDIPLTDNDIKAVILDMITAATETTSSTLEWAMAELAKHPKILKKAQEEVRRVIGGKSKIKEADIHQMVYLKSIIKETLRFHPTVPLLLPRECIKNTTIQGYDILTKTMVYINAWAIGRDPASWEKAEEFEPERFLNSDRDYKGQDFMFIPFGAGRRGCPGISFAVSVIELALANLLQQFDWGLPNEMNIKDLDMTESSGIACSKKSALFLVASPHFN